MRYNDLLRESLDPKIFDEAAASMRKMSWQEDGFYTIKHIMARGGYLDDPDHVEHKSKEFNSKFIQWSKDAVVSKHNEISGLFKNGRLRVWREIIAPEDWEPNKEHPGLYWSWNKEAAEAHWGDQQGVPFLLSTTVTENQIDWVQTLAQNATHHYEDEKEIRLKTGSPVTLDRVERR